MASLCLPGLFTIWPCDKYQSAPNTVKHICQAIRGGLFPNPKVNWPMTSHNFKNDFLKSQILEIICTQYATVFAKVMYNTLQKYVHGLGCGNHRFRFILKAIKGYGISIVRWSFHVLHFLLCRQCRLLIIMQSRKLLTNLWNGPYVIGPVLAA